MNTLSASSLASLPWQWLRRTAPGLALSTALALTALYLAQLPWFSQNGLSALTVAIVLGLLLGNTVYPRWAPTTAPGVALSKQQLLRTGIVLYGLRLTFQDIAQVGWAGVALDALVLASTFGLACVLGLRLFGLDKRTTLLIGAGSSICGAAAVLATDPVAKGRAQDVAVAIATVVVFGTVGTFLYPALYQWNAAHGWLAINAQHYGLYVGATVHEVAQVVAAGAAVSPEATNTAVIANDGACDDAGALPAAAFRCDGAQPAQGRRSRRWGWRHQHSVVCAGVCGRRQHQLTEHLACQRGAPGGGAGQPAAGHCHGRLGPDHPLASRACCGHQAAAAGRPLVCLAAGRGWSADVLAGLIAAVGTRIKAMHKNCLERRRCLREQLYIA